MRKQFIRVLLIALAISLATGFVRAQGKKSPASKCQNSWDVARLVNHCEIREQTIPLAGGPITVQARRNGAISIKGADRSDVLMRAWVQTAALSEDEAESLANQIQIQTAGMLINADGPIVKQDFIWSINYELLVPRHTDVSLEVDNGAVSIADIHGTINFNVTNGAVALQRIGGAVTGQTRNGSIAVDLAGDGWDGDALDVTTGHGNISMSLPAKYSANLELRTLRGTVKVDLSQGVQGQSTSEFFARLGSGGARLRAVTENGEVSVRSRL